MDEGDALANSGLGASLAPRTRENTEQAFGRYLYFCRVRKLLIDAACVGDYLDLPCIRAFIMEDLGALASQTRFLILGNLNRAFRVMNPSLDRTELKLAMRRMARTAEPVREIDSRLVSPPELCAVADRLFAEAERDPVQGKKSAVKFRNGLIVLIGALHGFRRENLRMARLDMHFIIRGYEGRFEFSREVMKGRRTYAGPLAPEVVSRMKTFIEIYRPRLFAPGAPDVGYLFPAWSGELMSRNNMSRCVMEGVHRHTGRRFSFHMFRYSAATFIAEKAPERMQIARHLLHHRRFRTTSKFCIRGQQTRALKTYQGAVCDVIKKARHRLRRRKG